MAARNTVSQLKIVIPRGRSAAEQRLAAIAALHQPMHDKYGIYRHPICGECDGDTWPCATARLLGSWPGQPDGDDE